MTVRIDEPALDNTMRLMIQVLTPVIKQDERVKFLCPAGDARRILPRLRVQISREREKMRSNGKPLKRFRLFSSVHPETHSGVRYDAIICWKEVTETQELSELAESLMKRAV